MGLSIEIRKFINSKHVGEFVDVTLPGELPKKRSEIRSQQRDSAAIEDAKRKVKELAGAKLTADKALRSAGQTLSKTKAELDRCSLELAQLEQRKSELQPDFDSAKAAYDAARENNKNKRAELETAAAELKTAEEEKRKAEQILKAATAATEQPDEKQKQTLEQNAKSAVDAFDFKRTLFDAAKAVAAVADETYKNEKSNYEDLNSQMDKLNASIRSAQSSKATLDSKIEKLTAREKNAEQRLDKLIHEHEQAEKESLELEGSVKPIESRHETVRFHYVESGTGETIILVHSVGQSLYTFNKIIAKLAHKYNVIAVDLPGHGYSDTPDSFEFSVEDYAESLARFMDAMGIGTAHMLGFSMGADYAIKFAAKHKERIDKLILIAPGGITMNMPFSVRLLETSLLGHFAGNVFSKKSVAKLLNECTFDHTILKEHDIEQCFNPLLNPDVRYSIRRCANAFDEEDALDELRNVEAETLLLWGDEDKWHPLEMRDEYLASIKNVKFNLVRNSGHLPHEERADRVCELIFDFIPTGYDWENT